MSHQALGLGATALRRQAVHAMRDRTASLVSDVANALHVAHPGSMTVDSARATASLLVTLIISAVEQGEVSARRGEIHDLQRLCSGGLGPRNLFHAVDEACRIISDELALDERLGAASEPWAVVVLLVRRAALDVLAALTERLLDTPAHGAVRDPLTTLVARPVFDLVLEQEINRSIRHHGSFAVILFDVDNLSVINREHGYGVGDRLLERLGIVARRFFRTHDWVARHGEDSIVALLPDTSLDHAALLATRFRNIIHQRLVFRDHKTDTGATVTLSAAAVAAEKVQSELSPAEVLAEAETAVARARIEGRNRTECIALLPTSVTLPAVATMLDCSMSDIRRLVRSGQLKAGRRGRHFHVDRAEIERVKRTKS